MFGEAADGTNALISLMRGNYADAALSAAAMIPFAGWAATAGKGAKYALKAADAAKAVKAADAINGVAKYGDEAAELSVAAKKYVDKSVKAQTNLAEKAANAQIKYVDNAVASQNKYIDKVNDVVNNSIANKKAWYKSDGSFNLPPNNGAVYGTEDIIELQPGKRFGRYGNISSSSDFLSEAGSSADRLSLPPYTDTSIYREYEVLQPIPKATRALVEPWGTSFGWGTQYKMPMPIEELIKQLYLNKIK